MHRPFDVIIGSATKLYLDDKGVGSIEPFAQDVREQYEAMVPVAQRTITWSSSPIASTRLNSDGKHVKRYIERNPKLPAELVPAWLIVLPKTVREQILSEFLAQFDATLVSVQRGDPAKMSESASLAKLMRECAEAVEAIAPMLEDGQVDESDVKFARNALMQLAELGAVVNEWQRRIASILPKG